MSTIIRRRASRGTTYGRKGGEGPTAGRRAALYEATLPDGSVVTKRSFYIQSETALMGAYQSHGTWYVSGVTEEPRDWPGQIFVPARRVS